jgi:hypothetical protein
MSNEVSCRDFLKGQPLAAGDTVQIFGGYSRSPIGVGTVVRLTKNFVLVSTPLFARPVRYRRNGPLAGIRVIGGLAEHLNDYIHLGNNK